ncbi:MAG: tRNA (adenosine(37)-N6)-threonylcarbamoyltransferase complex transferase subunit TsaD [Phycisphaeraceae bacterium]
MTPSPRILGIETSCDETAAAVVEAGRLVRASIIASQHALHQRYQGVVPEIASRAHLQKLSPVVIEALQTANVTLDDIDAVAVGNRPGLIGSLLVGVSAAQALAWSTGKPLIGIDHVQAHLYAPNLSNQKPDAEGEAKRKTRNQEPIRYPALGLVVSGGHTTLYHMRSATEMTRLGKTIDDAVGEAFDKAAVILNLGYPGGPAIDAAAQHGDPSAHELPISLLDKRSLDFSFSGLKTALLYTVRGRPKGRGKHATFERSGEDLTDEQRRDLAASFQHTVVHTLIVKLERALEHLRALSEPARALVIGGGVSANSLLRSRADELGARSGILVHLPDMAYCLDNAAMIAGLAHAYYESGQFSDLDLPAMATTAY